MKFQILLSTMRHEDDHLLDTMKVSSHAVVINQGKENSVTSYQRGCHTVHWVNMNEYGIGKSRNHALKCACSEIALFADDDIEYYEGYEKMILDEFANHPDADVIMFGFISTNPNRIEPLDQKSKRIYFFNCLKYGAFRIAFKTKSIQSKQISFSTLFGGGSKYGSGEDSLFIVDCLKKGCKIYASPFILGEVHHEDSTWFKGYDKKYFKDKGALFAAISPVFSYLLCLQYCIRHPEVLNQHTLKEAVRFMSQGIHEYRAWMKKEGSF